jgi:hypothetical protein
MNEAVEANKERKRRLVDEDVTLCMVMDRPQKKRPKMSTHNTFLNAPGRKAQATTY